ncbi:MAG: tetratricopeptide repeat protein [Deltaproteobacteria bacterium]|nr:tetratricopeptide repeat protein [Deltaproteobacteria bacterium]
MLRFVQSDWLIRCVSAVCVVVLLAPVRCWPGFGEFTIRDEIDLARKFDLLIESRFPVVEDRLIVNYVKGLVDRLVEAMPPQPFPVKVTVVRDGTMNAFASAAGHITVFTGLITNLRSEDELASVLAHELAHVSERHVAKSIEKSQLIGAGSLLGMLAGVLIGTQGDSDASEALIMGSVAGGQAMALKYSRANEEDADQLGLGFLVGAGFNPMGMTSAFERMRKLQWLGGGGAVPSYLATHPGMDERVGYMQERVARLPQDIRRRHTDNSAFTRVQALVLAWYADPNTALATFSSKGKFPECLASLGLAIAHSRLGQSEKAKMEFQQALACNGRDPLWQREYGRFSFEYGKLDVAAEALRTAVREVPDDLFALFFYARALAEQGDFAASITAMQRVLKDVPRDSEVLEHLGRYQAAAGRHFDAHVSFARAFAYTRKFRKYEYHLQRAESMAQSDSQHETIDDLRDEIAEYRNILEGKAG